MMKLITVIFMFSGFCCAAVAQQTANRVAEMWKQLQMADDDEKNYRFPSFIEMVSETVFTENDSLPANWFYMKDAASKYCFVAGIMRFKRQPARMIWLLRDENETAGSAFVKQVNIKETEPDVISADFGQLHDGSDAVSLTVWVNGNPTVDMPDIETGILLLKLSKSRDDSEKEQICSETGKRLRLLLENERLFDSRFADYGQLSTIISNNRRVKICTWNIENRLGEHCFFGAVAIRNKSKVFVYELNDKRKMLKNVASEKLHANRWFGCIYYDVVEHEYRGNTYYTLLGFNGNSVFSQIKVVDVLTFSENGDPSPEFGALIFAEPYGNNRRIVYEYSKKVTMMLRYDARERMIVMDNLSPLDPVYQNDFRFYGPDFSYNGLKFEKGKWVFYQNVILRNN